MSITTVGKTAALLTVHGNRLGLSHPDANGNASLLLDGYGVAGISGLQYQSGKGSITALAGGGQSSLSSITLMNEVNIINTVGTTSDSVMLPPTAGNIPAGGALTIAAINVSSLAAAVFPSSGDTINAAAANASLALASSGVTIFYSVSSGKWYTK